MKINLFMVPSSGMVGEETQWPIAWENTLPQLKAPTGRHGVDFACLDAVPPYNKSLRALHYHEMRENKGPT